MFLEQKDIIDADRDEVYKLVRDRLDVITPYLPNVEKIEVKERKELEDGKVFVINNWFAKVDIPAIAEKFIKKELFSWKDTATWDNDNYKVEYQLESFWAANLYTAKGTNYFNKTADGKTEVIVTCDVTIYADRVPGVPKFLVSKVLPSIEGMIKKILSPNLGALGSGLKQYFSQHENS